MNSLFASDIPFDVVDELVEQMDLPYFTHIVGIESPGFIVGQAIASATVNPMVMVRKKGAKYPGKLLEESLRIRIRN